MPPKPTKLRNCGPPFTTPKPTNKFYFFYGHRNPSQNRPTVRGGLFSQAPQGNPQSGRRGSQSSNKSHPRFQILPLGRQPERLPSQFRFLQCPRLLPEPPPPVPRRGPAPGAHGVPGQAPQREAVRDFDSYA
ncbi:Pentatricopeptide repeat-containing protein [Glycine soja]|nr:Pentatricopeptide repeat-containing protein [Glycine soja]